MGKTGSKAATAAAGASTAANKAGSSRGVHALARVGMIVSGVVHLLMGWVALQLAWAGTSQNADTSGALAALASHPLGLALLWAGVVGFLALAVWQFSEAVTARKAKDKVTAAAKTVVNLALAWSAFGFARGAGSDSAETSQETTSALLSQPAGKVLVIAVGVVAAAVGLAHVIKGVTKKFLEELEKSPSRALVRAGQVGYAAKGVAFVIVGGLFVLAAVQENPDEASGIDGALHALLELPAGTILLTIIALGLIAYGIFSFGRARHAAL